MICFKKDGSKLYWVNKKNIIEYDLIERWNYHTACNGKIMVVENNTFPK